MTFENLASLVASANVRHRKTTSAYKALWQQKGSVHVALLDIQPIPLIFWWKEV